MGSLSQSVWKWVFSVCRIDCLLFFHQAPATAAANRVAMARQAYKTANASSASTVALQVSDYRATLTHYHCLYHSPILRLEFIESTQRKRGAYRAADQRKRIREIRGVQGLHAEGRGDFLTQILQLRSQQLSQQIWISMVFIATPFPCISCYVLWSLLCKYRCYVSTVAM